LVVSVAGVMRSIIADLISASGYQAHTTSPSAFVPFVFRHNSVHRIPPDVRDDRETPLESGRDKRINNAASSNARSEIFLADGLDRVFEKLPDGQIS
jgi:hypothetical protein